MQICGREIAEAILERIRCRVAGDETLTRTGLSREVAAWLDWRDARGRVKDMSCRVALLKLARRGLIELPPARPVTFEPSPVRSVPVADAPPLEMALAAVGPIELVPVDGTEHSGVWRALMAHHPLGAGPLCGAQLRYLVRSAAGYLGALSFSAPAWRLAARDTFIGWNDATRQARLPRVVNNSRFLILPTVKVPNLASQVLSLAGGGWHKTGRPATACGPCCWRLLSTARAMAARVIGPPTGLRLAPRAVGGARIGPAARAAMPSASSCGPCAPTGAASCSLRVPRLWQHRPRRRRIGPSRSSVRPSCPMRACSGGC
jgi:hypothetical protein